jgi:hypothetical protein
MNIEWDGWDGMAWLGCTDLMPVCGFSSWIVFRSGSPFLWGVGRVFRGWRFGVKEGTGGGLEGREGKGEVCFYGDGWVFLF